MSTQRQERRGTASQIAGLTGAEGETTYATDDKTLVVHDGLTPGGICLLNQNDQANQKFNSGTSSGIDTITLTVNKAPSAYTTMQQYCFKAANTNTGAVTINVNSLGAKSIKKKNVSGGTLDELEANDILQNGIYTVTYNGTDFILESYENEGGLTSVGQGDLNTSSGTVSTTASGSYGNLTLPGGQYGFYPQFLKSSSGDMSVRIMNIADPNSYVSYVAMLNQNGGGTANARQRYITSSPPYNLGDGDIPGFLFMLMNKDGSLASSYFADVPPWAYNGVTDVRACKQCKKTGKKFRLKPKSFDIDALKSGVKSGKSEPEYEEITNEIKNADMSLIPAPFGKVSADQTIVLVDPLNQKLQDLIDYQNGGADLEVIKAISDGKIKTEDRDMNGSAPPGVKITPLIFK